MPRTLQPLPPQGRPHPESEQVLSQGISQQLSQRNANTARALATTMRAAVSSRPLLERAVARMPAASRINTREPWQTRLNRRGEGLALGIQNSRDAWGGERGAEPHPTTPSLPPLHPIPHHLHHPPSLPPKPRRPPVPFSGPSCGPRSSFTASALLYARSSHGQQPNDHAAPLSHDAHPAARRPGPLPAYNCSPRSHALPPQQRHVSSCVPPL